MGMPHNLTPNVVTERVVNATAAGTTEIDGTAVDTEGYAAVRFVALAGTITDTSVSYLKLQQSSDNGVADDFTDIAGSKTSWKTTGDSNNMVCVDVYKPQKRYVRPVIVRGTANLALDGCVAELYNASYGAVTQDATMSKTTILSNPAEGTA